MCQNMHHPTTEILGGPAPGADTHVPPVPRWNPTWRAWCRRSCLQKAPGGGPGLRALSWSWHLLGHHLKHKCLPRPDAPFPGARGPLRPAMRSSAVAPAAAHCGQACAGKASCLQGAAPGRVAACPHLDLGLRLPWPRAGREGQGPHTPALLTQPQFANKC